MVVKGGSSGVTLLKSRYRLHLSIAEFNHRQDKLLSHGFLTCKVRIRRVPPYVVILGLSGVTLYDLQ